MPIWDLNSDFLIAGGIKFAYSLPLFSYPSSATKLRPTYAQLSFPHPYYTLYRKFETNIPRNETVQPFFPNFYIHVCGSNFFIPKIDLSWNFIHSQS